ncbi:low molecular weight protein-tyrosine-phosphatase [Flagellimonas flava]|uniref:low molecular weight protein-tyrosine-phosphatase n=1 Tax=Flagellimonas flava TaxID=570519 RepID=UPI003D650AAE
MKTKVLMVCLGNICRSPLAEGVLRSKIDEGSIFVDSAGTAGYHVGNAPDKRSIAVALKHGIDISHQKCRKFSTNDFQEFDVIYVMDLSNFSNVLRLANSREDEKKVKLLLDEVDLGFNEVPDPYYGGPDGFENVYQMVDMACEAIAQKLS